MSGKEAYENYIKGFIDLNGKELAEYFGCDESEILLDDFENKDEELDEIPYKVIVGDVDLTYDSGIKDIGKLEVVIGNLTLGEYGTPQTMIDSLKNLKCVTGDFNCSFCDLESLENLKFIGGDANMEESELESTGELEYVGGNLYLSGCESLYKLRKLKYVGEELNIAGTPINDAGALEYVGKEIIADEECDEDILEELEEKFGVSR